MDSGNANYGNANQGNANYGNANQGNVNYGPNANYGNANQGNVNYGNANYDNANYGNQNNVNPNYGNANQGNPNYGNPNNGNPNYGNPNYGNMDGEKKTYEQTFQVADGGPKWNDKWAGILFLLVCAGFTAVSGIALQGYGKIFPVHVLMVNGEIGAVHELTVRPSCHQEPEWRRA